MVDTKKLLQDLQDLHDRLVLNYNNDTPFEQFEEDRLAVNNAIDEISRKEVIQNA